MRCPTNALVFLAAGMFPFVNGSDNTNDDLDGFTKILSQAVILLPDFEASERIGFVSMSLSATNVMCYDMHLGDLNSNYDMESAQRLLYNLDVERLELKCDFDFDWNFGILRDGGSGTAIVSESSASTVTAFASRDFDLSPPHSSTTEVCNADINIADLEFKGGVTSTVLSAVEGLVSMNIEREVSQRVCDELSVFSNDLVQDMLQMADAYLAQYTALGPPPGQGSITDLSEFAIDNPDGVELVDLTQFSLGDTPAEADPLGDVDFGEFVMEAIEEGIQFFSSTVPSDQSDGSSDLGVNVFLRNHLLENDPDNTRDSRKALIINAPEYIEDDEVAVIGAIFNPTIAAGHNAFFDYSITLDRMKIYGLDSFTKFQPKLHYHNHTYQMEIEMEKVDIELYLDVNFKPSTLENSLLVAREREQLDVTENIRVDISIDNFEAFMGIILAVEKEKLENLEFGSFMYTTTLMQCLLSTLHMKPTIYGLSLSISEVSYPTINGFLAPGIDEVASTTLEAIFEMYGPTLSRSLPSLLYTLLDDVFTAYTRTPTCRNYIMDPPRNEDDRDGNVFAESSAAAARVNGDVEYVDLRDLFLSRSDSIRYGGSGTYPYGDVFPSIMSLVQNRLIQAVDSRDGESSSMVNRIIGPITRLLSDDGTPGTITYGDDLVNHGMRLAVENMEARIRLRVTDLRVENVDSIGEPLALLENIMKEPYLLNNTVSAGVIDGKPLRVSLRLGVAVNQTIWPSNSGLLFANGATINNYINNEVRLTFNLHTASIVLTTLLKLAKDRLGSFPLRDVANIYCWTQMIPARQLDEYGVAITSNDDTNNISDGGPTLSIEEILTSIQNLNIELECFDCTSPQMHELVDLLNTEQATDDITELANKIGGYITELSRGSMFQTEIDRYLHKAQYLCPHNPLHNPDVTLAQLERTVLHYESFEIADTVGPANSITNIILLIVLALAVVVLAGVTILFVRSIVRRRHHKWLSSLPRRQLLKLQEQQNSEKEYDLQLNATTKSMFASENDVIPVYVRYLIPVIIVANIALFLSGHFSVGGTVEIVGEIAGQSIKIENFFEFSMAKSTVDLYNAGGVELAVLIFLFSGVWPYTKQIITLVLWFLPPNKCSVSRRGSILIWLDVLAKWSFVDIFALVVSLAAFRIQIFSPQRDFLPEGFYEAHLILIPVWGLYANMLAQLISQISSHFIIHYHRRIIAQATKQMIRQQQLDDLGEQPQMPEKLCYHSFARPHRGESDRLTVRRYMNGLLVFVGFALSLLLILGCIFPSFELELFGLLGVAIELGQDFQQAIYNYSVFGILNLIMDQAHFLDTARDYVGLGSLSAVAILCVLFVPIMQTCALLVQWLYPMTGKFRRRMTVLVEVLQAWQYVEVYIISVAVASWQLAPISTVMLNQYCAGIDDYLNTFAHYGVLDASDAQCFQMNATIGSGTYLLFVGAILLAFLNSFIMKAVTQYSRDTDSTLSKVARSLSSATTSEDSDKMDCGGDVQETSSNGITDATENAEIIKTIEPVPVLFTDRFRWFLIRMDDPTVSRRISIQFAATARTMDSPQSDSGV